MTEAGRVLLDAADTSRRLAQNGVLFLGILLLFLSGSVLKRGIEGRAAVIGGVMAVSGLLVMVSSFAIRVRWDVDYEGHRIRFENDPFRGERLFIDGRPVAKGGLGRTRVLEGRIPEGARAGDRIVASSEAGFTRFKCRIVARSASET